MTLLWRNAEQSRPPSHIVNMQPRFALSHPNPSHPNRSGRQACPFVAARCNGSSSIAQIHHHHHQQQQQQQQQHAHVSELQQVLEQQLHLSPVQAAAAAAALQLEDPQDVASNCDFLLQLAPHSCLPRIQQLIATHPGVLACPLAAWSTFLLAYGVPERVLLQLLWRQPEVIERSSPHAAGTIILQLRAFGLSNVCIHNSVLARAPGALLLDVQQHLLPLEDLVVGRFGLQQLAFRDLLAAAPAVMLQDVQTVLEPRLRFLQQELDASQADMSAMLQAAPGLLLLSDSATFIQPRLQLLRGLGFSHQQLRQLLAADARLLSNTLATLQRKWRFLQREMGLGPAEVLQQCPGYFSLGLLLETGPRFSYWLQTVGRTAPAASESSDGSDSDSSDSNRSSKQRSTLEPAGATTTEAGPPARRMHLGKLLLSSLPEFLEFCGLQAVDDEVARYVAFRQQWAQTDGLKWTGVRGVG